MKRRMVIALLGAAATTWPIMARAQQPHTVRRIGVLQSLSETDPGAQDRVAALRHGLQTLGWTEGRNISIDYRWGAGDPNLVRSHAAELVASRPDVIVASPSSLLAAVQRETRTIPIVFAQVTDPVGAGFVASFAHPPASRPLNLPSAPNGWSCSSRSHRQ